MLKRWRVELIALVAAIAVGVGIGLALDIGGTSEEARVSDVAAAYLRAFADDDPVALCNAISPAARVQLEFSSRDCATTARTSIQALPKAERDALRDATVTVETLGDTDATVRFAPKLGGRDDMRLVKRDGQWYVNP